MLGQNVTGSAHKLAGARHVNGSLEHIKHELCLRIDFHGAKTTDCDVSDTLLSVTAFHYNAGIVVNAKPFDFIIWVHGLPPVDAETERE